MLHKLPVIFGSAAILLCLYYFACRLLAWVIHRSELSHDSIKREENGDIGIYADAENLEYMIRCALLSSRGGKIKVVVNICRTDDRCGEMIDMTEKIARTNRNLTYRLI